MHLGGHVPALVTNAEVMEVLSRKVAISKQKEMYRRERARNKNYIPPVTHKDWVEDRVLDYLKNSSCFQLMKKNTDYETHLGTNVSVLEIDIDKDVSGLVEKLTEEYQLTDAECLQILNLMPKEVVDLYLIIQDLPDRIDESRQQQILDLISKHDEGTIASRDEKFNTSIKGEDVKVSYEDHDHVSDVKSEDW